MKEFFLIFFITIIVSAIWGMILIKQDIDKDDIEFP